MTNDPALESTGEPYAYSGDNPENETDPSGFCSSTAPSVSERRFGVSYWSWSGSYRGVPVSVLVMIEIEFFTEAAGTKLVPGTHPEFRAKVIERSTTYLQVAIDWKGTGSLVPTGTTNRLCYHTSAKFTITWGVTSVGVQLGGSGVSQGNQPPQLFGPSDIPFVKC